MEKLSFNKFNKIRNSLLNKHKDKDHIVIKGLNNILISAPHGVSQVRLGKYKAPEIGSLSTAIYLQQQTNCFLIAKTQNNYDDANFDEDSLYKKTISSLIHKNDIKYILDFHGLAAHRDCDINLGTHLGQNIKNNPQLLNSLHEKLIENDFKVSIDQPFMGGSRTISGTMINKFNNIWTIQIEINCAITNRKENFDLNIKLLNTLIDWIKTIK